MAIADQTLTLGEIEARYAGEWVLIADPEVSDQMQLLGGRVVCHSPDKATVYRLAEESGDPSLLPWYAGEDDQEYWL